MLRCYVSLASTTIMDIIQNIYIYIGQHYHHLPLGIQTVVGKKIEIQKNSVIYTHILNIQTAKNPSQRQSQWNYHYQNENLQKPKVFLSL